MFRVGLMQLTDAAPLIVARELGFFATEDLEVSLSTEPSWANIADKLAYGLLDGAMLLPPLAIALRLGLSGSGGPEPIIVPAALSLNGNTVTLADRWAAPVLGDGAPAPAAAMARRFRSLVGERGEKPVLAVVHTFSTHNLLLRFWLAAGGIDPDRDTPSSSCRRPRPPRRSLPDGSTGSAPVRHGAKSPRAPASAERSRHRMRSGTTAWKRSLPCASASPKRTRNAFRRHCARYCGRLPTAMTRRTRRGSRRSSRRIATWGFPPKSSWHRCPARCRAKPRARAVVPMSRCSLPMPPIFRGARRRCGFSAKCGAGAMSARMLSPQRPCRSFAPNCLRPRPARSGFRCRSFRAKTKAVIEHLGCCRRAPCRSRCNRISSWTARVLPQPIATETSGSILPSSRSAQKSALCLNTDHRAVGLGPGSRHFALILGWHRACCVVSCSSVAAVEARQETDRRNDGVGPPRAGNPGPTRECGPAAVHCRVSALSGSANRIAVPGWPMRRGATRDQDRRRQAGCFGRRGISNE